MQRKLSALAFFIAKEGESVEEFLNGAEATTTATTNKSKAEFRKRRLIGATGPSTGRETDSAVREGANRCAPNQIGTLGVELKR